MSMTSKKNRIVFVLIVSLAVLLFAAGCGKKESAATAAAVSTPASSVETETVESTPAETLPAEVSAEAIPEEVAEVAEEVVAVDEPSAEIADESESPSFPVVFDLAIGEDKISIEAYDGYAFVAYSESLSDDAVESFATAIVEANPDIEDLVGWTIEEPGLLLVAYPFGLTPDEIGSYVKALETLVI